MAWDVQWMIQDRLVVASMRDETTIEELLAFGSRIREFTQSGQPPVHVIVDTTELVSFPTQLSKLNDIMRRDQKNWAGITVIVTSHRLLGFMGSVITQVLGVKFQIVKSVAEALAHIQARDETL